MKLWPYRNEQLNVDMLLIKTPEEIKIFKIVVRDFIRIIDQRHNLKKPPTKVKKFTIGR